MFHLNDSFLNTISSSEELVFSAISYYIGPGNWAETRGGGGEEEVSPLKKMEGTTEEEP